MRRFSVLVGLFVVSSCASSGGRAELAQGGSSGGQATLPPVLSPWRPTTGQECHTYVEDGFTPPPAATFVDFPVLQRALGRAHGYAVLELAYDSLGVRTREIRVEGDLPEEVLAHIRPAIPTKLPVPPKRLPNRQHRGWLTTLRVDAGDPPSVRFGPIEVCRPLLRNQREITHLLRGVSDRLMREVPLQGTRHTLVVDIHLDSTGVPIRHAPRPSKARPRPDISIAIAQVIPRMRFHPMIANRRPVRSMVTFPVTLHIPAPPRRPADPR